MIWKEVEERYGKEIADKMAQSDMLTGITVVMRDGEADIPYRDIDRAYMDVIGGGE